MTTQPWPFEPTKKLHDLFQEKFGKVWENTIVEEYETVYFFIDCEDKSWIYAARSKVESDEYAEAGSLLPALTFSAFCEFVDDVFESTVKRGYNYSGGMYHCTVRYTKMQGYFELSNINNHLKHFAIDNWEEPEKVIEEVKKYL